MKGHERIVNTLFMVVLTVVAAEALVYASDDLQPSIPGNDYVLRSCMSSVELSRRNVNSQKSKSHPSLHSPRGRPATLPAMQYPISRYPAKSVDTRVRGKPQQKLLERMLYIGRPGRQIVADTPLTTLKVERRGRKNVPQLYVKKELLPEIESSVADGRRNKKNEASIILIQSAPLLFSKQ